MRTSNGVRPAHAVTSARRYFRVSQLTSVLAARSLMLCHTVRRSADMERSMAQIRSRAGSRRFQAHETRRPALPGSSSCRRTGMHSFAASWRPQSVSCWSQFCCPNTGSSIRTCWARPSRWSGWRKRWKARRPLRLIPPRKFPGSCSGRNSTAARPIAISRPDHAQRQRASRLAKSVPLSETSPPKRPGLAQ